MRQFVPTLSACAFLGRRCGCGAGGHSVRDTGPEGPLLAAVSGAGRAGLCPAGANAGEERA